MFWFGFEVEVNVRVWIRSWGKHSGQGWRVVSLQTIGHSRTWFFFAEEIAF